MRRPVTRPTRRTALAGLAAAAATGRSALAQPAYPDKPVRIVVAYSAGGANDVVARLMAEGLRERLGGSFVVENRPGAGGSVGSTVVARAPADGATLLLGAGGAMTINPTLYPNLPYDPVRDFEPVSLIATSTLVLVVPPSSPFRAVADVIAAGRGRTGTGLTYASAGIGTPLHVAGELFRRSTGLALTHVPYPGTSGALTDLMAGRVDLMFDVLGTSLPLIRSGELRALAVTAPARDALVPDLPTLAESGLAGYDVTVWYGLFAPAGTPGTIVSRLNAALRNVLASPETRGKLEALAFRPAPSTPETLGARVRDEIPRWAAVIGPAQTR